MGMITKVADRLWAGDIDTHVMATGHSLVKGFLGLEALDDRLAFVGSFANVVAVRTDEGLVLVDTSSPLLAPRVHEAIRAWSDAPLHTAVFTHGHVDHCFGVPIWEREAEAKGHPKPHVLAHERVPDRFDRYRATAGYNGIINQRQFRLPAPFFPTEFRYPDETFRQTHTIEVGGTRIELTHARGETDDHAYAWLPEQRVLCTGDMFIWASPNCGNPQKAQRYPREWAAALRDMASLRPRTLLPGHGPPILGEDRVAQALDETARLLETLVEHTLAAMNAGATLDEVLHSVTAPQELLARPYLRPVYDQPEFIVRNLWRLYGGWYDGDPSELEPAPRAALARELVAFAGGTAAMVDRALALSEQGEHRLACHLVELAWRVGRSDAAVGQARRTIYTARAEQAGSVMARGIYEAAAQDSKNGS